MSGQREQPNRTISNWFSPLSVASFANLGMAYWPFWLSCLALFIMLCVSSYRQIPRGYGWFAEPLPQTERAARPQSVVLTIAAPASIRVGESTTITVVVTTGQPATGNLTTAATLVQLFLLNTDGARVLEAPVVNGQADFTLSAPLTETAGTVRLVARFGQQQAVATLAMHPGPPVEPLLALVGPRSITADGDHWTMLTALPYDAFGNAVADDTAVTVHTAHPATTLATDQQSTTRETITTKTEHLLAWARIYSRTKTGRMYIAASATASASASAAHSPERTVLAVPGPPVPFGLQAEPVELMADGRRLITIFTDPIIDEYANPLLNGTIVTFIVTSSNGTERRLSAQLIDGKATVQLQAPIQPDRWQIKALLLNTTSRPLSITFAAGIGVTTIALRFLPGSDLHTLIAGPLLGPLDQYIPDGSEVVFTILAADSDAIVYRATVSAQDGFANIAVRAKILPAGRYRALVSSGVGTGELHFEVPSS